LLLEACIRKLISAEIIILYTNFKLGKEVYIDRCKNEGSGITWRKADILQLRGFKWRFVQVALYTEGRGTYIWAELLQCLPTGQQTEEGVSIVVGQLICT